MAAQTWHVGEGGGRRGQFDFFYGRLPLWAGSSHVIVLLEHLTTASFRAVTSFHHHLNVQHHLFVLHLHLHHHIIFNIFQISLSIKLATRNAKQISPPNVWGLKTENLANFSWGAKKKKEAHYLPLLLSSILWNIANLTFNCTVPSIFGMIAYILHRLHDYS